MIFKVALVGVILRKSWSSPTNKKAVIKNDFFERRWNAYKSSNQHSTKVWNRVSVYRLLKRFQEDNSLDRRAGSGRQRTITTEEKTTLFENLICSQEDNSGSHMSQREVEKKTVISHTSVRRMMKKRGIK